MPKPISAASSETLLFFLRVLRFTTRFLFAWVWSARSGSGWCTCETASNVWHVQLFAVKIDYLLASKAVDRKAIAHAQVEYIEIHLESPLAPNLSCICMLQLGVLHLPSTPMMNSQMFQPAESLGAYEDSCWEGALASGPCREFDPCECILSFDDLLCMHS